MNAIQALAPLPFPLEERGGKPHVAVVVPVYNEEGSVAEMYRRIRDALEPLDVTWDIVFVNDGSRDSTIAGLEALFAADERVSYLGLARNFGHQAALSAGLDHASGDLFITLDGDLQHPPELLPTLIDGWRQGYDVIHATKESTEDLSPIRRIVTRIAYRAISLVASVRIVAHASDFRLLTAEARDAVAQLPERGRLYRGLTAWVGFRQATMPYVAAARANGTSQYGVKQLANLFGRAFFDFSAAPLYVALVLGAGAIVLCFAYLAFVVGAVIFGKSIPPGYVTQIVSIGLLSSINLFLIGVLSVYVSRIYDEVRQRPSYVVGRKRLHTLDAK